MALPFKCGAAGALQPQTAPRQRPVFACVQFPPRSIRHPWWLPLRRSFSVFFLEDFAPALLCHMRNSAAQIVFFCNFLVSSHAPAPISLPASAAACAAAATDRPSQNIAWFPSACAHRTGLHLVAYSSNLGTTLWGPSSDFLPAFIHEHRCPVSGRHSAAGLDIPATAPAAQQGCACARPAAAPLLQALLPPSAPTPSGSALCCFSTCVQ